ncbi:hypothetical protein [Microbacterium sp.]|uniref:hypothetical protein n=1 Tax=Microbacterium sp. TaxID=51671 RepID=UPI0028A6826B|nr:hypothetical protein [Microbacterium sp.]
MLGNTTEHTINGTTDRERRRRPQSDQVGTRKLITPQVGAAVAYLQQLTFRRTSTDAFDLDRIDRALDQILAHPDNTAPAPFQVRDARANASKVLAKRRTYAVYALDNDELRVADRASAEEAAQRQSGIDTGTETFDILWWIASTTGLTDDQRSIIFLLADGEDAESLATRADISVARMREQISRARRVARLAYDAEVRFS